ncbi:MAG: hypothetical protein N3A66_00425 [Planctomycetota bacterium]|nr:hypothetical protein [Planctomycetota bacterium]
MRQNALGFLFCLSAVAVAGEAAAPTFLLNGKPVRPAVLSLAGTPEQPQAGDIVLIDGILLTLGEGKEFRFCTDPQRRGLLLQENAKGDVEPIALEVEFTDQDTAATVVQHPAMRLSAAEFRKLRGLRLDAWWPRCEEIFRKIDPNICCLTIAEGAAGNPDRMPPLPLALRYLNIDRENKQTFRRFDELRKLRELRYLAIGSGFADAFDLEIIAGARELRYLDLRGEKLTNLSALSKLTELRVLRLADCPGVEDLSFAASLAKLAVLDIRRTAVQDLAPLAPLPDLSAVDASASAVKKLPVAGFPALKMLRLLSTPLAAEGAADFAAAHPQCRVVWRWRDALAQAVAECDRLVVRSGGLSVGREVQAKILFEIKDPAGIAAALAKIEIDEEQSRQRPLEDGDPTLEFYRGERLLAAVEMHGGESLRWIGWPYDGCLTAASADAFTAWLAENGVRSPGEALARARRKAAAAERRWSAYFAILPEDLKERLAKAGDRKEILAAFERAIPSAAQRAFLYLRLYGIDATSWDLRAGIDQMLEEKLLPSVAGEPLSKALADVESDQRALNGASRWLLGRQMWGAVSDEALNKALPVLAKHGLSHPRPNCRRRTILALTNFAKHPEVIPLLRAALGQKIAIRELPAEEAEEPDGEWLTPGEEKPAWQQCSECALAAQALAACGDAESFKAIRDLAAKAEGADKEVLSRALTLLELLEE